MNSAAAARAVGATPPKGCFSAVCGPRAARRSSARGARANSRGANSFARAPCREAFAEESVLARGKSFRSCAVSGATPPKGCFSGCSSVGSGPPFVGTRGERDPPRGKSFRPCAVSGGFRRGERFCAGQILSPVRRVGRPSPRGTFSRGANSFARAPCRETFAVGSVPARGKSLRLRAVSGGLRRGERFCAGKFF